MEIDKHSFLAEVGIQQLNPGAFGGSDIGGGWFGSGEVVSSTNPATGKVSAESPDVWNMSILESAPLFMCAKRSVYCGMGNMQWKLPLRRTMCAKLAQKTLGLHE